MSLFKKTEKQSDDKTAYDIHHECTQGDNSDKTGGFYDHTNRNTGGTVGMDDGTSGFNAGGTQFL
nr:hypothetical protein [uncultured Muribaculum sp.]